jgi:23S rRNA (adenine2503-C2)-methyltransferase
LNKLSPSLAGLLPAELELLLSPVERMRVMQIYKWITRGAKGFEQMTNIPSSLRDELSARFNLYSSAVISCHDDAGVKKIVAALKDGLKIESVLLNDGKNRLTACLSTQAGCPVGCLFCKTGRLGFHRNLDCTEIIEQLFFLRSMVFEKTENKDKHIIDNIVIMGMGEPLLNIKQLRKAIAVFCDPSGMNYSKRRITVSTCGICEGLFDIAENGPFVRLALSLVTGDENLRQKLIPAARSNPLQKIKEALVLFQHKGGGRITLEIPLLGGINTSDIDAASIAEFAEGIDSVVNIIPWNPVQGLEFEGKQIHEPGKKECADYINKLESYGLKVTTRFRKGRSIMGACGQLGA